MDQTDIERPSHSTQYTVRLVRTTTGKENPDSHWVRNFLQLQEFNLHGGWELRDGQPLSVFSTITASDLREGPILSQILHRVHIQRMVSARTNTQTVKMGLDIRITGH
jgi:hypothetical protein